MLIWRGVSAGRSLFPSADQSSPELACIQSGKFLRMGSSAANRALQAPCTARRDWYPERRQHHYRLVKLYRTTSSRDVLVRHQTRFVKRLENGRHPNCCPAFDTSSIPFLG